MFITEASFEDAVLEVITSLGYEYLYGPDVERDYRNPLLMDVLTSQIRRINPGVPKVGLEEALKRLTAVDSASLVQMNRQFSDWLQNGLEVSFWFEGEVRTELVRLLDFVNPEANSFHVVNQWTVEGLAVKRPDVVVFVNGLPLVIIELKTCMSEGVDVENGYRQLRNYLRDIERLFIPNVFCMASDLQTTKVGTITADYDRYMEWKTVDGSYEDTRLAAWDTPLLGMLEPARLLDLVQGFVLYSGERKILAAYHQYFAVKKAVLSVAEAASGEGDGRGGVFWHTQGSGKSLSMVFFVKQLQSALSEPTVVVITDRNDLDDQLFGQFSACHDFLRQTPRQAESRADLMELLNGRQANGIFFTTMQKFEERDEALSLRRNIVVVADEAHRGHYGLTERVVASGARAGQIVVGAARLIRDALPGATFVGFTGTPLSAEDRNTYEVFGNCIDAYDMTQAVEDGATRPVYYEARVINLGLDEGVLDEIDRKYELLAAAGDAEERDIERSKKELSRMESLLGAEQTIDTLCRDLVAHYEERAGLLTGKAMIVAYSRRIAMQIYQRILELRPGWSEKVKVVMTGNNNDPEEWHDIVGNKRTKEKLARRFKDDNDEMKIAVVVDMWLTGFDIPSLATMYFYKPMAGHNLMQAIARVNRVFTDSETGNAKEGGLVVDYIGVAAALKVAMNDYTARDRSNYGDMDVRTTAYIKFQDQLAICRDLLHGLLWNRFVDEGASNRERMDLISDGINFVFGFSDDCRASFLRESLALKQAGSLCQSLLTREERYSQAFVEAVRVGVGKIVHPGKVSLREINRQVAELLEQSVRSEGVINLFEDVDEEFSIFDEKFLAEVLAMKRRNLAAELLRKLLDEQIRIFKRTNLVQAEKFSERMKKIMNAYRNGQLTNAQVIDELRSMAGEIAEARGKGDELGLNDEELAFYDALTKPAAVKDVYTNDELKAMVQELADELRSSRTIDWQKKDSARAGMRRKVKKLLKKYKYPPEGQDDALKTVIEQCEMWADAG